MINSYLTKRQYALIAFFIPFVFKFSVLPSVISLDAGRDIWITIFIIMLTEIIQLLFIVKIDKMGGLEAIKEKYGLGVYLSLSVPLLIVLVIKASVYTSETTSYANSYLFYNITTKGVGVIVVLASAYIAIKGAKGLGRLIEQIAWLVPIAIIIGLLFGKLQLKPSNLLPIGAGGIFPIAKSYDNVLFWALDFSPLLFLQVREDVTMPPRKRSKFPILPFLAILSLICMTLLYALYVMNYGQAGHLVDTAFSSLGAFNVVNTEIGSIDWPAITLWLSIAIISLALKLFGAGKILTAVKLPFPLAVGFSALVVVILGQYVFYNLEKAFDFATSIVRYFVIGVELVATFVSYALLDLKERKSLKGEIKVEATI